MFNGKLVDKMIINTKSSREISSSLASYFGITEEELYQYIDYAADKSQQENSFNVDTFQDELINIFSDLYPEKTIDEMYVYHLTRRLNDADLSCDNLKELLLTENVFRIFLQKHKVTFFERDEHPILYYCGKEVDLSNESDVNVLYLRRRLGYNSNNIDYCFNGFAFKDLLMNNSYTYNLYECPEFIDALSHCLNDSSIKSDYFNNSKYYCVTYKLKINEIVFDGKDLLTAEEKIDYFISQLCLRLLDYRYNNVQTLSDSENPIIRVKDDVCIPAKDMVEQKEITREMLKI